MRSPRHARLEIDRRLLRVALALAGVVALMMVVAACAPGGAGGPTEANADSGALLGFLELEHDFGKISAREGAQYRF